MPPLGRFGQAGERVIGSPSLRSRSVLQRCDTCSRPPPPKISGFFPPHEHCFADFPIFTADEVLLSAGHVPPAVLTSNCLAEMHNALHVWEVRRTLPLLFGFTLPTAIEPYPLTPLRVVMEEATGNRSCALWCLFVKDTESGFLGRLQPDFPPLPGSPSHRLSIFLFFFFFFIQD